MVTFSALRCKLPAARPRLAADKLRPIAQLAERPTLYGAIVLGLWEEYLDRYDLHCLSGYSECGNANMNRQDWRIPGDWIYIRGLGPDALRWELIRHLPEYRAARAADRDRCNLHFGTSLDPALIGNRFPMGVKLNPVRLMSLPKSPQERELQDRALRCMAILRSADAAFVILKLDTRRPIPQLLDLAQAALNQQRANLTAANQRGEFTATPGGPQRRRQPDMARLIRTLRARNEGASMKVIADAMDSTEAQVSKDIASARRLLASHW